MLRAPRVLERRKLLNGFGEVRDAIDTLNGAGVADKMKVFDTFYHAWNLGEKSYNV